MTTDNGSFRAIWGHRAALYAFLLFLLSFIMLPIFPPIYWLHDGIIEPFTTLVVQQTSLRTVTDDHNMEIWVLSGILVNFLSIIFAVAAVIGRGSADSFDLFMQWLFGIVSVVSLVALLFVRFIAPQIVIISLLYYFLYCACDGFGAAKYWHDAKSKSTYIFPLLCLDLPALGTTFVILSSASDDHFAHAMAAGHLVFGAIAYFGLMAILLPWALAVLCKESQSSPPEHAASGTSVGA